MGNGIDHRDLLDDISRFASTIANADEIREPPGRGQPPRCLICQREVGLAVIVILKGSKVGPADLASSAPIVGVCSDCRDAGAEDRRAAVAELARAAGRAEALLSLVRHRADAQLSGWWGGVGACRPEEIDAASVELRRAIERLGPGGR